VVTSGVLLSHKGVNFPDCTLSGSAPTKKDLEDLAFGLENGVDFVALSFVQTPDDITVLRREIERLGGEVGVIAKLERGTALQNLDAILGISDGVMVARGDLGIEMDLTMVPIYQKQITAEANGKSAFSIIATQMLDSMMRNPLPTRAEVTDVANAIHDGADAIMLSGETAVGKHPIEAVRTMREIANHVEENIGAGRGWRREERARSYAGGEDAIARSVCTSAEKLGASLIVAHTLSGETARLMSRSRPSTQIVALTPSERTHHRLSIAWGVESLLVPGREDDFIETVCRGDRELVRSGLAAPGDLVIVSAGVPAGESGGTNMMKVHRVGEIGGCAPTDASDGR
jgi:pyruvate kinase